MIPDLERAIAWYLQGEQEAALRDAANLNGRRALRALLRALEQTEPPLEQVIIGNPDDLLKTADADAQSLSELSQTIQSTLRATRRILDGDRARRGRRRPRRLRLAAGIALVFENHGLRVAASRDGDFAKTMAHVYDLADVGVPQDTFRDVRNAIQQIHLLPAPEKLARLQEMGIRPVRR